MFISFNFDNNFKYTIIYWILEIIIRIFLYIENRLKSPQLDTQEYYIQNEYSFVILRTVADLLSGFFILYIKCSLKKNKGEIIIQENSKNYAAQLIIISILDLLGRSYFWIAYAIAEATKEEVHEPLEKDIRITLDILMRYSFYIVLLEKEIYVHKKYSLLFTLFGFILLLGGETGLMLSAEINRIKTLKFILISSFRAITSPLQDVFIKKVFDNNHLLPAYLMFYRAVIEAILLTIITVILWLSFEVQLVDLFWTFKLVTFIVYTLASSVKYYFLLYIIYHLTPQSVSFLLISESIADSIFEFIDDTKKTAGEVILWIVEFLGIIIIVIAILVYDEVIIINKWGFDKNTNKEIQKRSDEESDRGNFPSGVFSNNSFSSIDRNEDNSDDDPNRTLI